MRERWKGMGGVTGVMVVATFIHSSNFVLPKLLMPEFMAPYALTFLRVSVAGLAFLVTALLIGPSGWRWIKRSDWPRVIGCVLFGGSLNLLLYYKGLSESGPINAALLMATTPLFVLLIAVLSKAERFTFGKAAGIAIGFAGATMLLLVNAGGVHLTVSLGDLLILLSAMGYGFFLVWVKPLLVTYPTVPLYTQLMLAAALVCLPFSFTALTEAHWPDMGWLEWALLGFICLVVTYLVFRMNAWALRKAEATRIGAFIFLQPLFATLISLSVGMQQPQWIHLPCALLILGGVLIVQRARAQ